MKEFIRGLMGFKGGGVVDPAKAKVQPGEVAAILPPRIGPDRRGGLRYE